MTYRLAAVSFLNALPLIDWLLQRSRDEVQVVVDLPSRLAELLHADFADAALVPVVEHFHGQTAGIVPGIGIASNGAVDSVKLFSRVAPSALEHVAVDRGSRTSVALLRILLAELHGCRPDFHTFEPDAEDLFRTAEAALVIGDRCFAAERFLRRTASERDTGAATGANDGRAADTVYILDLGELWHRMTGLPFVFAAWGLGAGFVRRTRQADQLDLVRLLTEARDHGLAQLDALAAREAAADRLGPGGRKGAAPLRHYFRRSLCYVLGAEQMKGLRLFHELCVKHTICPAGHAPVLAAVGKGD